MKSSAKANAADTPEFRWEHQSEKIDMNNNKAGNPDFDAYFEFLDELKPHPHELEDLPKYTFRFCLD